MYKPIEKDICAQEIKRLLTIFMSWVVSFLETKNKQINWSATAKTTAAVSLKKLPVEDQPGFGHSFRAEESLYIHIYISTYVSLFYHPIIVRKNGERYTLWRTIYIYIYTYIYIYILPYPRRVEFSCEELIVLPLAPLQVSSYPNWDLGGRWTDVCKQ